MNDLIEFDSKRQVFHLHNRNISYIFSVAERSAIFTSADACRNITAN